jgi:hypothetical protein
MTLTFIIWLRSTQYNLFVSSYEFVGFILILPYRVPLHIIFISSLVSPHKHINVIAFTTHWLYSAFYFLYVFNSYNFNIYLFGYPGISLFLTHYIYIWLPEHICHHGLLILLICHNIYYITSFCFSSISILILTSIIPVMAHPYKSLNSLTPFKLNTSYANL